jgi:hypothetical protein
MWLEREVCWPRVVLVLRLTLIWKALSNPSACPLSADSADLQILLHHPASNILSLAQPETPAFQMRDIITIDGAR